MRGWGREEETGRSKLLPRRLLLWPAGVGTPLAEPGGVMAADGRGMATEVDASGREPFAETVGR